MYVDAGSSGTRMNLAVNPDCKVKDENMTDKVKLSLTFTKGTDGKFDATSATKFNEAFNKLYSNLKKEACYAAATKDGVTLVNFAL